MRIILFSNDYGTLINFRGPLLKAMLAEGHEAIACAPGYDKDVVSQLNDLGVAYHSVSLSRTGLNPFKDLQSFNDITQLFHELEPDVVLSYTIKPVIYGSLAARRASVKHIYSLIPGLGYSFTNASLKQRVVGAVAKFLYKFALERNDAVFFQNPDDRALFVRLGLVDETKAVLVNGSGVDLSHYKQAPLTPVPATFLLMARLIKDKGILDYVAAARTLRNKYPDAKFQLLGPFIDHPSGIRPQEVEAWVAEGIIEYLGATDDVRPYIRGANVYVLPSFYREGTPKSVLEAMAMGRPVITTDAPGCRETVRNGENGFLVPVHDPDRLAEAMETFILQPALVQQMGAKGHQIAKDRFDVNDVNAVMLEVMGLKQTPSKDTPYVYS